MTARSNRKNDPLIPRKWRRVLLVVLTVVLAFVGLHVYDYFRINLWIERDAGHLENYPMLLIDKMQEVPRDQNDRDREIDRLLIEEARKKPRNPVTLSRSEIKRNLLGTRVYAKVILETALPDKPDIRTRRLRGFGEFKQGNTGWQLVRFEMTTIE